MGKKLDVMYSQVRPDWGTPKWLFYQLDRKFAFTLDVAASKKNALCSKFFTEEDNGLKQSWRHERVWCNPPYGRGICDWVVKALSEDCLTVMLLPARTDTKWYEIIKKPWAFVRPPNEDRPAPFVDFLTGRLKFEGAKSSAPFPSMLVYFL